MSAPGSAPEPPGPVVPRRVVPRTRAAGTPPRRKLRLVEDGCAGEGAAPDALPATRDAPAGAGADPPPRFPDPEPPGRAVPAIVYLLAVTVCGTMGFVAGLSLFGTLPAAVLAYLGAGFAGLAGAGLLARGFLACGGGRRGASGGRRGPQRVPAAGADVTGWTRRPNGKP